jgi:hypothetical protein
LTAALKDIAMDEPDQSARASWSAPGPIKAPGMPADKRDWPFLPESIKAPKALPKRRPNQTSLAIKNFCKNLSLMLPVAFLCEFDLTNSWLYALVLIVPWGVYLTHRYFQKD